MSMLARYRKPGGLHQLVVLLESCLTKKREMLLNTVCAEDKQFGELVKASLLTAERVFSWDPLLISEATTRMADRTLAILIKGMGPEAFAKATHTMRDLKKREVQNLLEVLKPTAVEIESAKIKLVEKVRELEKEGSLKLDDHGEPVLNGVKKVA